jgi:hypothetical protein
LRNVKQRIVLGIGKTNSNKGHIDKAHFFGFGVEFLLIFFAVSLSFLAENLREEYIGSREGKALVISLKEDLAKDTLIIDDFLAILQRNISGCDSILKYLNKDRITQLNTQKIYLFNLNGLNGFTLSLTDRTAFALKSGVIKQINNKKLTDLLVNYWQKAGVLQGIESNLQEMRTKARDKSYRIFDSKYYERDGLGVMNVHQDAKLLTEDPIELAEFKNRVSHFKNTILGPAIKQIRVLRSDAGGIINLIEKDYKD